MKHQARRLGALMLAVIMTFMSLPVTAADEVEFESPEDFIEYVSEYNVSPAALDFEEIVPFNVDGVIYVRTRNELLNALTLNIANRVIMLQNDIELVDALGAEWQPINISETAMGTFTLDGNGHTLTFSAARNGDFAGLFGDISSLGNITIRNLGIFISDDGVRAISSTANESVWAGGIAGRVFRGAITIENSFVRGAAVRARNNVWSQSIYSVYAGGFFGEVRNAAVTIKNSYVNVTDITTYTLSSSAAADSGTNYAGGFVGLSLGSSVQVETSYATGVINLSANYSRNGLFSGGIIGRGDATVTDCIRSFTISANYATTPNQLGTSLTPLELRDPTHPLTQSIIENWDWDSVWTYVNGVNANFPVLRVFHGQPVTTPPMILLQPINQSVLAGQNVTFTASALGNPAPSFQWQVSDNNGATWSNLSGQTNSSLTLSNTTVSMNNNRYRVIASNSAGSVASNAATLFVLSQGTSDPSAIPVTVSTGFAHPGEEVTVEFFLKPVDFASMMFRITVPPQLTMLSSEPGHPDLENGFVGFYPNAEVTEHYAIGWAGRSENFTQHNDNGLILRLTFAVCPNAELGYYPLTVEFGNAHYLEEPTNEAGEILQLSVVQGGVRARQVRIGDINGDGRITSLDSTMLAKYLVGQNVSIDVDAAHILCEDTVTLADLTRLSRWLGGHFRVRCPKGGCVRCT